MEYILHIREGEKAADVHCSALIPLALTVRDQRKYYPCAHFVVYERGVEGDEVIFDSLYDDFKRVKTGFRVIHGPRPTGDE